MALAAVTSQNVASGKELQVQSLAIAGGTLYVSTVRGTNGDLTAVTTEFVATATAGSSSGSKSIGTLATVGNGVITGALVGDGIVSRTGPTSAFTDTTGTAASILAALPQFIQNSSMTVDLINTTNFTMTVAGGTNVTASGQLLINANSVGTFLLTRTDANTATPTFNLVGLFERGLTVQPNVAATALTTVGAGIPLAAGIVGGVTTRGGAQSGTAFSDTTDTAAAIIAAMPNANVGQSFFWDYVNNTNAQATILGGASVTMSGPTVVPQGTTGTFLVTMNGLTTVTMQGIGASSNQALPNAQNTAVTAGTGTAAAGTFTGALVTVATFSTQAAITVTTRTGTQMAGDIPNIAIGQSYLLRIMNTNSGLLTLTAAGGVTISIDNPTVAAGCFVDFLVTYTAANTFTWVGVGGGAIQPLPYAKITTLASGVTTGTLAAGQASGAAFTTILSNATTPGAQAMRTPAQVLADAPGLMVGQSYMLQITQTGAGTFTLATDSGAGFTMTGTMTIAQNFTRTFLVNMASGTTGTVTSLSIGTYA